MSPPPDEPRAGGVLIALALVGGAAIGVAAGQPTIGLLAGAAAGGAAATLMWWRAR